MFSACEILYDNALYKFTLHYIDASDLQAVTNGNALCKYADDTYLIIPAVNVDSRSAELHSLTLTSGHLLITENLI